MKKYRSPVFMILLIIAVAAFVFIFCYDIYCSVNKNDENASVLNVSWCNYNGLEINTENRSQIAAITDENGSYSLYHTVENDNPDAYVSFKNSFSDTKILVNDKEIYSTEDKSDLTENSLFFLNSSSPRFHIAELGGIKKGDVITINVSMFYKNEPYGVSNIMVGSLADITEEVFESDLLGIVLCVALFVLGIILLIFYFAFRKTVPLNGIHFAGIFAVLSSVYSTSESVVISAFDIVSADALYVIHNLAFVTLVLPVIMFFMDNTKFRGTDKFLQVTSVLQVLVIFAVYILGISGISDLHETRLFSVFAMIIQFVLIFIALILDFAKRTEKRNSDLTLIAVYVIFTAGLSLQLFLNTGNSISMLFVLSSLFFTVAVLIIRIRDFAKAMELSSKVEAMGKIAYTDGLTGVGNTAAFKKKMNHLEVVKVNYQSIGIVQFDINNLKTINDTLGHEMGDKLITDGSALINKYFGEVGDVYRTGGDEFVAIICRDNAFKLCNEAILKFELAIDEYNSDETHRFMLQIAYGADFYHSNTSSHYLTLKEVHKHADVKMYEKKRELKELAQREGLRVIRNNSNK